MSLYLGLDVGTQSVKAVLLDPERGIVGTGQAPLAMVSGLPPGHSEQAPADWLRACSSATRQALAALPGADSRVRALAVSGQQHGLVALDAERRVIRPAKLWNDVSSAAECEALTRELGGMKKLFAATGNRMAPGFTGGKVRWLRVHEPQNFARLQLVLLPHEYVNLWLTGVATCEAGDASGTGWFDVRARAPSKPVCDAIAPGLQRMLPRMLAPGEPAGRLEAEAAQALGLPPGLLVGSGSGDNMMAAIGAGAVAPGILVMSLGTSGTVFACADRPICDEGGEIAAFCDATGQWLPLGCTMNATVSTELTRRLFDLSVHDLESLAHSVPAGSGGVLCLPFFTGERSPDLPHATGAFLGLTPANSRPGHFARAAYEGATYAIARLVDRLAGLGVRTKEVRLCGGGSSSLLWRRIVASVLGMPIQVGIAPDAAALGAAVSAMWTERRQREPAAAIAALVRELPLGQDLEVVAPDPEWTRVYQERRVAYEATVQALHR